LFVKMAASQIDATNLIVNYIPTTMDEEAMRNMFTPHGEIVSCKLVRDKTTGMSMGYGFVKYADHTQSYRAISALNGSSMGGKRLKVALARPSADSPAVPVYQGAVAAVSEPVDNTNVYIAGMPLAWKEQDIRDVCSPFGIIVDCKVLLDASGLSRGVGFVRMQDAGQASKVINALSGTQPAGAAARLTLKLAEPGKGQGQKRKLELAPGAIAPISALAAGPQVNFGTDGSTSYQQQYAGYGGATDPYAAYYAQYAAMYGADPAQYAAMYSAASADPSAAQNAYAAYAASLQNPYASGAAAAGAYSAATAAFPASAYITPKPSPYGGYCLYVANLPIESVTDADITRMFSACGKIVSAKVMKDPATNKSRGFAFVNMASTAEADVAIKKFNGFAMEGKKLTVKYKE
jgi:ELAV like protein 2/3/4